MQWEEISDNLLTEVNSMESHTVNLRKERMAYFPTEFCGKVIGVSYEILPER